MKKITQSLLLISFVLVSFCNTSFAQETIYVTLNVDTDEVRTEGAHNHCSFEGQPDSMDTREYTVNANVGDVIVWNAVSTSSGRDEVKITSINYEGGTNVFSANKINGENGVVSGTITKSTAGRDVYKYNISFKIVKNGNLQPGTYVVDPKIKVGS